MMNNSFLSLAVACLVWAPVHFSVADPPVATCVSENGDQTQTYQLATIGQVRITCPGGTTLANRGAEEANDGPTAQVYSEANTGKNVALNTLLIGGTYVRADANDDLTVSQLPSNAVTVYFLCNKTGGGGGVGCWIGVQVAAQPPLGPQGCTVGGSEVTLTVTAANATAQFACAATKNVFPEGTNVYNSDCSTETPLSTALPGATLTRGDMNALRIPTLPAAAKNLCFVCATNAGDGADQKCSVKINVSGSPGESPNGSVGLTARAASALGIFMLGAALVRNV
uniref:Surface antigen 3 n=4 Tax=Sarcocystis TaxID=5812 RepID=D6MUY5_SARFA|nr:surface antigen 3 [Sarcocystis falcatula]WGM49912.1 surface antigen 3 [Sarcocystis sp.]